MSRHLLHADALRDKAQEAGDSTDYAIARRTGIDQSTLSRLLAGRTTPSVSTLMLLRATYAISLDDLMGEPAAGEVAA